jgi:FkbM family methyltransferase
MLSRLFYYLHSIVTLLAGVRNWDALARLLAGRPPHPASVTLRNGARFRVRSFMDLWIIKETCLDRDYERDLPPIGEEWTVMDIGAGLGDFSVSAARNHAHRKIAAFEPFSESVQLLRENLALNGIANVQVFSLAVGKITGPMQLQTATGVAVRHSTAAAVGAGASGALAVEGVTLDEALRMAGFDRCELLKVDCEGGEYDIFFHAGDAALKKIQRIAMEYHDGCTPASHTELAAFLRDRGFSVRLRTNPVHRNLGFLTAVRSA